MSNKGKSRLMLLLLYIGIFCFPLLKVHAEGEDLISAPSGVLMEASTGEIVYEKAKDERRSPASITKIMTLILIFDELEHGKLNLTDEVTTSAHAKSMGGSQVFLEEGEKQNVETMIKCIVIASGNDASVAMAEHIAGSESEFVNRMNKRAGELGMTGTHFEDCCGLTESENHYTTAYDVALMSRELITKYPEILDYSSIWMEDITHVTKQGSKQFTLTNTNKLLRSYDGCVGLKTGSTSIAKYCVSNVAVRNGISLISVIMAAPDYKVRFKDSSALLNYGFGKCSIYVDKNEDVLKPIPVTRSVGKTAACGYKSEFRYLDTQGNAIENVEKKIKLPESTEAPVQEGDKAGTALYYWNGSKIGEVDIVYQETVEKSGYLDFLRHIWENSYLLNGEGAL